MRQGTTRWVLAALTLTLLLLFAGCGKDTGNPPDAADIGDAGGAAGKETAQQEDPVIVRLEGGDWGYPTPFAHYSRGPGSSKMRLIFDSLLERDEKGCIPWLAEKWDVEDNGTRYVFHIRRGVKWHDGRDLTAHDVAFSFNYYREHPPVSISDLVLDPNTLLDIKAPSDYEVQFLLDEANATFLEAAGRVAVIPRHIWSGVGNPEEFTGPTSVIGTGPFCLEEYSKEHGTYQFTAFEGFWGPRPRVDVLEFIPVSDPVLALTTGETALAGIPADVLPRFRSDPAFTVMPNPGFWGYRLRFNLERLPAFQDRRLRQAMACAIDRRELVDKLARGEGIPGSMGILSPHHRWYNPEVPAYGHDPDRARQLIADSGATLRPSYELLVGGDREVRIGELLKEQLAEVGIQLQVVSGDMKTRDARIAAGDYELVLVGHGGWGKDPDFLRTRFCSTEATWYSGTPGYVNPEVDALAVQQLRETDEGRRRDLVFELQRALAEDVPEIPLYLTTGHTVFRHDVYDGWMHVFDHHAPTHNKLSYLERQGS